MADTRMPMQMQPQARPYQPFMQPVQEKPNKVKHGNFVRILLNSGPSERGWHRIEAWERCKLKYALVKLLHHSEGNQEALVRGSLVHTGVGHFYARKRAEQRGQNPEMYWEPMTAMRLAAEEFGEAGRQMLRIAEPLVAGYLAHYQFDKTEVLHVEEAFEVQLAGKYKFTQRYDRVERAASGKIFICDTKTAASVDAKALHAYTLSGQFLMAQAIGPLIWGSDFGGIMLDFVGTTGSKKMQRMPPMPAPWAISRVVNSVIRAEQEIEWYEQQGILPLEYPGAFNEHACMTRYGPCPFYLGCQMGHQEQPEKPMVFDLTGLGASGAGK